MQGWCLESQPRLSKPVFLQIDLGSVPFRGLGNEGKGFAVSCPSMTNADMDMPGNDADLHSQVTKVIELMRPSIQSDGGDIELVSVSEDGHVQIRFHGACVGCPSSSMTLQMGIEQNLKTYVPGFQSVETVDDQGRSTDN